jgi:hypothetical protein
LLEVVHTIQEEHFTMPTRRLQKTDMRAIWIQVFSREDKDPEDFDKLDPDPDKIGWINNNGGRGWKIQYHFLLLISTF